MKLLIATLLFISILILTTTTMSSFGITYDEFNYFHSTDLQIEWFVLLYKGISTGDIKTTISDDVIKKYWNWEPHRVPHPPFSRILSAITKSIFYPAVNLFTAYRLSVVIFFALLTCLIFLWASKIYDLSTAIVSSLSFILMPHVFGLSHIGITDIPLTFFWFASAYTFYRGLTDWRWSVIFGIVLGLAFSTKFSAFFIPIPLLVWAHIYKRRMYYNNLFSMIFLSPIIMFATQPYLWHKTIPRLLEFMHQSITRMDNPATRIPTYFFHEQLLGNQLPLYYPFFITAVSIPLSILLVVIVGIFFPFRKTPIIDIQHLLIFNTIFILIIPILPGGTIHDGVRLLLPAFPFLAAIGGTGFFHLKEYIKNLLNSKGYSCRIKNLKTKVTTTLSILIIIPAAIEMIDIHPNELMYYNNLVGGVKGAYALGLETTYLGEAFNKDFIDFLNRELPQNASINASFSSNIFINYQRHGILRKDIIVTAVDYDYYILLCRRGYMHIFDKWLFENRTPTLSWQFKGVPLINIYKFK
ncbi:MAG: glycosyltransferase family 39 protein [Nitrospirota bacterium]